MQRMEQRIAQLPRKERAVVAAAARALLACGAYEGTETDAVTDARAIVEAVVAVPRPRWWR